jgi:nucleoside-diphosphate-sugar epimerase
MLARTFSRIPAEFRPACVFASGVSDSMCRDPGQFAREEALLRSHLEKHAEVLPFVYFGTCSVDDPAAAHRPYIAHKRRMEEIVLTRNSGHVVRLPQVAGPDPSPHTLLAALCRSIRAEAPVEVWRHATRNIIDCEDVAAILVRLLAHSALPSRTFNIANPASLPVPLIIETIEEVLGMKADKRWVEEGAAFEIDVSAIHPTILALKLRFDDDYLARLLRRYYA